MNERLICWQGIWYICHESDAYGTPWFAERDGSMVCTVAQAHAVLSLPTRSPPYEGRGLSTVSCRIIFDR